MGERRGMNCNGKVWIALAAMVGAGAGSAQVSVAQQSGALGIFESQSDVGAVNPAGMGSFDAASGVYTIASSGRQSVGDH